MAIQSRTLRIPLVALTALTAAALASGCSSNGHPSALPTNTSTPSAPTAAPATSSGATVSSSSGTGGSGTVLGGPALQSKLNTVKAPAGFTVDSSSLNASGATPTTPGDYVGLQQCSDLTNSTADTLTNDHEASYAEYDIKNSSDLSVTVVVAEYYPGDAEKQMSEVASLVAKCSSYQAQSTGGSNVTVKVTSSTPPGLGDQALDVHLGAGSNYVSNEYLLVRKGDVIVAMDQDDASGSSLGSLSSLITPYLAALA